MKLLSRFGRHKDEDDEDLDLDLEVSSEPESDTSDDSDEKSRGLLSKLFGRRNSDDDDDRDGDDDDDPGGDDDGEETPQPIETADDPGGDDDGEENPEPIDPAEDPPVQLVRLDGVSDVRPVGDSSGGLAAAGKTGEATSNVDPGDSVSENPATGAPGQDDPDDTAEPAGASEGENKDKSSTNDLDISLKDIFEDVMEVDESLKDLADSQEDVPAGDLAIELKEFLAELEN